MIKIAIYGKGGIGKSTTAANLAAALASKGLNVMQIGCDPKADSTSRLLGGEACTSVLDLIRESESEDDITLDDIVHEGYGGVHCVESGGPTPGVGCAGRGIITAFEKLEELDAYEHYKPDAVLYDVLGDVVCGGFAMPMRRQYADYVYIVTSGEKMSLFAARNIAMAVDNFKARRYAVLGGIILNRRNVENEKEIVENLAKELETEITADIPRCEDITRAENMDKTVIEAFPESEIASIYMKLAEKIIHDCDEK